MKYRQILMILILLMTVSVNGQKVSKSNPTYMLVDNDFINGYLQKELKSYEDVYFTSDSIPPNANLVNLKLVDAPKIEGIGKLNKLNLFQLDTNTANYKGAFRYYQNPKYLDLIYENANRIGKKKVFIGYITKSLLKENPNWKGFVKMIIYMGAIGTYDHLNAELVISEESSSAEYYSIGFNVVWHYCTNDCYDPKYKFELKINLNTGEIWLIGK